jgi:hypothetical protein
VRIDVLSVMLGEKSVEYPKRFLKGGFASSQEMFLSSLLPIVDINHNMFCHYINGHCVNPHR